jgi:hypothetical protein
MRILVLMPCDERAVYVAAAFYRYLPDNLKEQCFSMPMFMDYLVDTSIVKNWIRAFYYSLVSAEAILRGSDGKESIIICGNVDKKYDFDIILNLQADGNDEQLYQDNFIEHLKTIVEEDPVLAGRISNLYGATDSILPLYNAELGAQLVADLIATDNSTEIDAIKKRYQELAALRDKVGPDVPIR